MPIARHGAWLHQHPDTISAFIKLKKAQCLPVYSGSQPRQLVPVIQEFEHLVTTDSEVTAAFTTMMKEGVNSDIPDLKTLLELLNETIAEAPQCIPEDDPIGIPMYAILKQFVEKPTSYIVFTNPKVNAQIQKIFKVWTRFLVSPSSRDTLTTNDDGWFGPHGTKLMPNFVRDFACRPNQPHFGFTSWDDFFVRKLNPGARPIASPDDNLIINCACDSACYRTASNVEAHQSFWLKGQTYSLYHILDDHDLTSQFVGGTVMQATLSPTDYHRWHTPINGRIIDTKLVKGTFYAPSPTEAGTFPEKKPNGPQAEFEDIISRSQGFMTAFSTRALIFIECVDPRVGLMCFVGIGLGEVSTCEITVDKNEMVKKGDEIGMFHFGGSTHCLIFRPGVDIHFVNGLGQPLAKDDKLVINAKLAEVVSNELEPMPVDSV
ncbi:phosphatidylserine decarboxylase-domain-containing protein [Suillus clintonianus]|uniref:phosphatidylserine decarboxylase-domain-containing protein n=1 Tax=Suillus clintonianus TaxID=1904413 RepID=UPI001B8700A6|nr:phosphatidylserine decarboxylase-domain-containing protein [Suillus clintonianus]KAG2136630.1 phosphatidylserine decarboxylase-domain-containing protein [Suillus clintonianus]